MEWHFIISSPSLRHFVKFPSNRNNKTSHIKHFKLNSKSTYIPVADLCVADVTRPNYSSVVKAFAHALDDYHIDFDCIDIEGQMLVAKQTVTSWLISE